MDRRAVIHTLFNPRSVAVLGARENAEKMGNWCVRSLVEMGFPGKIFLIHPRKETVLGLRAYPSVMDVKDPIDMAIVVVPAPAVGEALIACAKKGVKGAVVITSGFKEKDDPAGPLMEQGVVQEARAAGIRFIGPNTFGMVHTHASLNASFSPSLCKIKKGGVSMIGQSGGVSHLFMYSAIQNGVGLNKVVGLGNRADLDFDDFVDYLSHDPGTRSIALYMEGMEDPRPFLEHVSAIVPGKPIVVLKGGKSEAIQRASVAHTGVLAGRYGLYEGSIRQFGMVKAEDPLELLDVAKALSLSAPPAGDRIAILSVQAGVGILMTDLCMEKGLRLASFKKETLDLLNVPWRGMTLRINPVDLGFALTPDLFRQGVEPVLKDPHVDALILSVVDASTVLRPVLSDDLIETLKGCGKPCVISYIGAYPELMKEIQEKVEANGIPFYPYPLRAVNAMAGLVRYGRILKERKK